MTAVFTHFAIFPGNTEQIVLENKAIRIEKKGKLCIISTVIPPFSIPEKSHPNPEYDIFYRAGLSKKA